MNGIKKNISLLCLVLLAFFRVTYAQNPPTGTATVKGILKDSVSGSGIEFGAVSLYTVKDSALITGAMSDEHGVFSIDNVLPGRFYLKIKCLGYKELLSAPFMITREMTEKDLGLIWVVAGDILDGVEIVEYTEVLEMNLDKKVINVEKDLTSTGGTALDLMKNVPSVTVDMDGNVSLRGNSSVRILIDGRPSTMDPSTLLQQLPASMIKQIEVITNPSAKYDPDGVTGIINLVTKKTKNRGFNGVAQLNVGTGSKKPGGGMENFTINKYSGNINLNYKTEKVNFFGSYDARSNTRWNTHYSDRNLFAGDSVNTVVQNSGKMRPSTNHTGKAGLDWNINDNNLLSVGVNVATENGKTDEEINYFNYYDNYNFISNYNRYNKETNKEFNYGANIDYKKTFAQKGRELTGSASYMKSDRNNIININELYYNADFTLNSQIPLDETINNKSGHSQQLAQVDYVHPLKEKFGRIETGAKMIRQQLYQDLSVVTNNTPTHEVITDSSRTNRFEYDDQVYAAYLIYGNTFKKFKYQAGLRAEQFFMHTRQVNFNTDFYRALYNLFPSAHIRYEFTEQQEFSASYSRRINRPSNRQLNPFPDYSDKLNWRVGNPYLLPEYTNSFELGHSYMKRGFIIATTLFYRYTDKVIYRYKTVDTISGVSIIQFVNMTQSQSYGAEWVYNQPITKWLRINSNFSAYYFMLKANKEYNTVQTENFAYSGRMSLNITSPGKIEWQITGTYRSPNVSPQGLMKPMYFIDIGFKKDILNKKGSVSFRMGDIFNNMRFAIDVNSSGFRSYIFHKWESRTANLTFQYSLNNGNERREKRNREMENGGGMEIGM